MALAETQYARSGDADIAYQVIGDGPRDVMVIFDWGSHLEEVAAQPLISEFIGAIVRFSRLLWFDMRGIGMSGSAAEGISSIVARRARRGARHAHCARSRRRIWISFEERGEHELKGVPDLWALYAAVS